MPAILKIMLQALIRYARDLHEPGELNPEYTHGQVNLIMSTIGLCEWDDTYEILTDVLNHRIDEATALERIDAVLR